MWTMLFAISIAQGLFLISLFIIKKTNNPLAVWLIAAMVGIIILTNFGYVVIRTPLLQYVPWFFALPFGMIFLFGPLFYFYTKAVTEPAFTWKAKYWLHFVPYCLQLLINLPFFTIRTQAWGLFIQNFFDGDLHMRPIDKAIYIAQDAHLFIYLFITFRNIKSAKNNIARAQYIIPLASRLKWLTELSLWLYAFLATVISLYIYILFHSAYNPVTNYIYTLVTGGIIYFIAYKAVLQPEAISPGFAQKYKAYMQFGGAEGDALIDKLTSLMNDDKIYTNPDLKLAALSLQMGLPAHQLSKLINEKFGKPFNDYINEYRVQEFIRRIQADVNHAYTVYGIALDVGFNSKSAFNTAFKKITGKNPSDFRAGG